MIVSADQKSEQAADAIYDNPMIYSLSILMLAGIPKIAIILSPGGLAQAFILTADFLASDNACMILGDKIFFGHGLDALLAVSTFVQAVEVRQGLKIAWRKGFIDAQVLRLAQNGYGQYPVELVCQDGV